MNIRDKLRFEIQQGRISLQPNRGITSGIICFAIVIIITIIVLTIFSEKLGEGGEILGLSIIAYSLIHGLTDYIFRYNVCYTFDKNDNAIYRKNFGKRKLMKLDEAAIFTTSESGSWHYSLGIKKKQFLKSYKISPDFGSGKTGQKRAEEFETDILEPIIALLEQ